MDIEDRQRSDNYLKAKKRVDELKGFYMHLLVYVLVNIFISTTIIIGNLNDGVSLATILSKFGVYSVWIFWGIGIFFHGIGVLKTNVIFGKDWQRKKIQQYLEEDKEASKKFLE